MIKKSQIYTGTGDKGTTSLVGGVRISKTDLRLEAYGGVDELNSFIGLLMADMRQMDAPAVNTLAPDLELLEYVQNRLFNIGSYLATEPELTEYRRSAMLEEDAILRLEHQIDVIDSTIPPFRCFILPGGCRAAASANVARTVCRRVERAVLRVAEVHPVDEKILRFINRLSDYLFILSRACNISSNNAEVLWNKSCK